MGTDVLKSQTGTGASKRIMAAVSAILALVVMLFGMIGLNSTASEVTNQTPVINDAVSKLIEAVLMLISAGMAIWSKWQDRPQ